MTRQEIAYWPQFFNRSSVDEMRGVILSPYGGLSVEERWEIETPWLAERIKFPEDGLVVDYGCGIGRMAKALQRAVVGVDLSHAMLLQAITHVARQDFIPVAPMGFRLMVESGFRAPGALAIWSLQHARPLQPTVDLLMRSLKTDAPFWLLDLCVRAVPAMIDHGFGMIDDGQSVLKAIEPWCELELEEPMEIWREPVPHPVALRKFRRKPNL